jgi:hypothetical protein
MSVAPVASSSVYSSTSAARAPLKKLNIPELERIITRNYSLPPKGTPELAQIIGETEIISNSLRTNETFRSIRLMDHKIDQERRNELCFEYNTDKLSPSQRMEERNFLKDQVPKLMGYYEFLFKEQSKRKPTNHPVYTLLFLKESIYNSEQKKLRSTKILLSNTIKQLDLYNESLHMGGKGRKKTRRAHRRSRTIRHKRTRIVRRGSK